MMSNSEPLAEGTVIMADNQFAGRGQQNSIWQAQPGKNISASIYLKPSFLPLEKQFFLNMAVSLAVSEALAQFLPDGISVKWPNDIYFGSKKLGGILIENTLTGSSIKSSVVGIGLNINQEEFAEDIKERATSVIQILQKNTPIIEILEQIVIFIEKYYLVLRAGRYDALHDEYLQRLYNYDIATTYKQSGTVFEGTIKGVTDSGKLLVQTDKELVSFNFKEIEFTHTK